MFNVYYAFNAFVIGSGKLKKKKSISEIFINRKSVDIHQSENLLCRQSTRCSNTENKRSNITSAKVKCQTNILFAPRRYTSYLERVCHLQMVSNNVIFILMGARCLSHILYMPDMNILGEAIQFKQYGHRCKFVKCKKRIEKN